MNTLTTIAASSTSLQSLAVWLPVAVSFFIMLWTALFSRSAKASLRGFVPAEFRPAYRPSRIVRFLVRCGGVHPRDLEPLGAGRTYAHAVAGALMFVPAGMAWVGVKLWMAQFLPNAGLSQLLWSTLAAGLVFLVDLGAVSTLNALRGKHALLGALPRVAFALMLGYWIAKPFIIAVHRDDIDQMHRGKKKSEVLDLANRAHEQRQRFAEQNRPVLDHFKTAKTEIQRRIESLTPRHAQVQTRYDELHAKYVKEVSEGQSGRPDGVGKYAKFFEAQMEKVRGELDDLSREEFALKAEHERLAKDEETAIARVMNDPKFAETATAMDTVMRETRLAEAVSVERQLDLVREYIRAGDSARWWSNLLWHLLFILCDTIPITAKLFMRKKDVQMLADMAERSLAAQAEAETAYAQEFAEEKARLRHDSEMCRIKLTNLIGDLEIMFPGALHVILRSAQVERDARQAYDDIAGRSPKTKELAGRDWDRILAPLHRVQRQILASFAKIISGDENEKDGGDKWTRDDDEPPSGIGLN